MSEAIKTPDQLKSAFAEQYKKATGKDAPEIKYVKLDGIAEGTFWMVVPTDLSLKDKLGIEPKTAELRPNETWKVQKSELIFPNAEAMDAVNLQEAVRKNGTPFKELGITGMEHADISDNGDGSITIRSVLKGATRSNIVPKDKKSAVEQSPSNTKTVSISESTMRDLLSKKANKSADAKEQSSIGLAIEEEPEKPKAPDLNTPEGLIEAFKEKAKTVGGKNISAKHVVGAEAGKSRFVFLIEKDAASKASLKTLGFSEKDIEVALDPKKPGALKVTDVESWDVSRTIMKSFAGGSDDTDTIRDALHNKKVNGKDGKPLSLTGMEFSGVSDNGDKGYTISNVVGASRAGLFGESDGGSIEKRASNVYKAIIVSETKLREAIEGKKKEIPAAKNTSEAPLIVDEDLDLTALAGLEKAAIAQQTAMADQDPTADIPQDKSGADGRGAKGGWSWRNPFGGRGKGNDGKSGGAAKG